MSKSYQSNIEKVSCFEISSGCRKPDKPLLYLEVNLYDLFDHHVYHDAPQSVSVSLSYEDAVSLLCILNEHIVKMDEAYE